jgi:ketosteroid isomerase-like protein
MSPEANKQAALRIIAATAAHDTPVFDELLCDDATFWTCGKPHLFPGAGRKTRSEIVAYMATPSPYDGGGIYRLGAVIAEGDKVMIESYNSGKTFDGRLYENTYIYLFTFRDGKILEIKEYFDPLAAMDFLNGGKG